jgi:hypothetical protein
MAIYCWQSSLISQKLILPEERSGSELRSLTSLLLSCTPSTLSLSRYRLLEQLIYPLLILSQSHLSFFTESVHVIRVCYSSVMTIRNLGLIAGFLKTLRVKALPSHDQAL